MVLRPKNNALAVEVRSVRTGTLSEVSAKGGFWCNVYTGMLNAGRFVEFLKDFGREVVAVCFWWLMANGGCCRGGC